MSPTACSGSRPSRAGPIGERTRMLGHTKRQIVIGYRHCGWWIISRFDVTRFVRRFAMAQVWMDHICLRPAAASGFRLTLKEGAEPSLGAPGPE